MFIRAEDGLCREVVKHLNQIEEQILDHLAWKSESPLWDRIRDNDNRVPTCEEVCESVLTPLCNASTWIASVPMVLFPREQLESPLCGVGGQRLGLMGSHHPISARTRESEMAWDCPKFPVTE